jgi:acyl-coenzyme A synthetase/AMP-(fatty) acid ligase
MDERKLLFLVCDSGKTIYSFYNFLNAVSQLTEVPKYIGKSSLYDFYVQLTAAWLHNLNIVLLDADFSDEEIETLTGNKNYSAEKYITPPLSYLTKENFIEKLLLSTATITLFTSGTTGQPKKVTHPVANFFRSVKHGEKFHHDVWALAYNPTHMAGLQVFFQALLNRNTLVYVFGLQKTTVLSLLQQYHVTNISATPTFYRLLMPADFTIHEMKRVTLGGEKSTPALFEQLKMIFPNAKITNIYASTEAGTLFNAKGDVFEIPENLMLYVKIENNILLLSKKLLGQNDFANDEWYNTGDVVEIVNENPLSFRFVSRSNEMINVGGNKVNPAEVEEILLRHEKIKNALVYAKPNSVLGNMLAAEIETHEPVMPNEIRTYLSEQLQDYKVPRIIKVVEKIETTRSGKIKRTIEP